MLIVLNKCFKQLLVVFCLWCLCQGIKTLLDYTGLIIVHPGVKIDEICYCDVRLLYLALVANCVCVWY